MYYYSTRNGIVTTHSGIEIDCDGFENVRVHFERPRKDGGNGFDFADIRLPDYDIYKSFGFDEEELLALTRYARNNAFLFWEFAAKGGGENA